MAISRANQQIKSLELSLTTIEKEISTEKKVSSKKSESNRAEYMNTAKLVRQELGNNINDSRLDLEVYLRADSKAEIIFESSLYQRLKENNPSLAQHYVKAISSVAGIYQRLSNKKTPDLDGWAKRLINQNLADFYLEENNRSQNIQPQRRRGRRM